MHIVWRSDIEARNRWLSIACQLLRMQRDIEQAKSTNGITDLATARIRLSRTEDEPVEKF